MMEDGECLSESSGLTLHGLFQDIHASFVPCCSMALYGTCRVSKSILVSYHASILVFLKCQKELASLTLTGMLVQLFPAQSSRLIVWTIRICFWMLLFPLSLSDPP